MSVKGFQISSHKFDSKSGDAPKIERRPGGWIILTDKNGVRTRFKSSIQADLISAHIRGKTYTGKVLEQTFGDADSGEEEGSLVAQFPGKVIQVLVNEGDEVKKGDPLLLVEAMKMEFKVEAPKDSKVEKLLVKKDQQVLPGDRFIELSDE